MHDVERASHDLPGLIVRLVAGVVAVVIVMGIAIVTFTQVGVGVADRREAEQTGNSPEKYSFGVEDDATEDDEDAFAWPDEPEPEVEPVKAAISEEEAERRRVLIAEGEKLGELLHPWTRLKPGLVYVNVFLDPSARLDGHYVKWQALFQNSIGRQQIADGIWFLYINGEGKVLQATPSKSRGSIPAGGSQIGEAIVTGESFVPGEITIEAADTGGRGSLWIGKAAPAWVDTSRFDFEPGEDRPLTERGDRARP